MIEKPNYYFKSKDLSVYNTNKYYLQVIKMLIWVVVLFLLCWGPRFILEILIKIGFKAFYTVSIKRHYFIIQYLSIWYYCFNNLLLKTIRTLFLLQPHFWWTKIALFMLPFIHAIFNPIIYFIMSRNFRQSAVKKFQQCSTNINDKCCQHSLRRRSSQPAQTCEHVQVSLI